MKKRQIKKNEKLHVKLYTSDEFALLTMTSDERDAAYKDYQDKRNKMANTRYRILKNMKPLHHFFPYGKKFYKHFTRSRKLSSGPRSSFVTQSATDIIQ
ncbi:MAG: hypothetical protein ACE3L7_32850 [Candidatus Pristimantibacillus sp.]